MFTTGPLNLFFLVCASVGLALLVVRIIFMIAGVGHGAGGADVHADVAGHDVPAGDGADADQPAVDNAGADSHDASHHGSSDTSFTMLTLQGIMGFLLMFGLTGYMLNSFAAAGGIIASAGAIAVGIASMWLIARLFSLLLTLQSSGTVDITNAMGQEGTVYLTIPPGGVGKVQVVVQGRLLEYEAVSDEKVELKPGVNVMVVYYKGNTLVVHKI
jgi:membrane protein implicated in regulation of membrane protease activity